MKKIVTILKNNSKLTYAIRREILNNGKQKLTPVVKESGWFQQWVPIVKVNDKYVATSIHTDYEYTEEDCAEYIHGHRAQIHEEWSNKLYKLQYDKLYF